MPLPKPNELIKLAKACRKAGIVHFKSPECEFTLDPEVVSKVSKELKHSVQSTKIETDSLTEEEMLFWSVGQADSAVKDRSSDENNT